MSASGETLRERRARMRRILEWVVVCGALVAGPLWLLWPALSGSVLYVAPKSTDLSGPIQFQQIYAKLSSPFTPSEFVNFPSGQSVTRWQELTQVIPRTYLWVASKVLEPNVGLAVFLIIGMFATGVCIVLLGQLLGTKLSLSVGTAIWVQFSPAMVLRTINHQNYVHWWVVILPCYLVLRRHQNRTESKGTDAWIAGVVLFCILFDPYYSWFVLFATLSTIAVTEVGSHDGLKLAIQRWKITITTVGIGLLTLYSSVVYLTLSQRQDQVAGRPLEVTPRAFIDSFSSNITDWFRPNRYHRWLPDWSRNRIDFLSEYSSWIGLIGILGIVGLFKLLVEMRKRSRGLAALLILVVFGAALPSVYRVSEFAIPGVSEIMRYLFPGVRFLSRLSNFTTVLLALGFMYLMTLAHRSANTTRRYPLWSASLGLLCILGIVDVLPLEYRNKSSEVNEFKSFASRLVDDEAKAFFFFPMTGYERMIQNYLAIPMANPLFPGDPRFPEMKVALSNGPTGLATELVQRGVTHVVTIRQTRLGTDVAPWNRTKVNFSLENYPSLFTRVASARVYGSYLNERITLDAYRISERLPMSSNTQNVGVHAYTQDVSDSTGDDRGIFWSYSGDLEIRITRDQIPKSASLGIKFTSIVNQTLLIKTSLGERRYVDFGAGESPIIWLKASNVEQITIAIQSVRECTSPRNALGLPDDRVLCFGIVKDKDDNLVLQK